MKKKGEYVPISEKGGEGGRRKGECVCIHRREKEREDIKGRVSFKGKVLVTHFLQVIPHLRVHLAINSRVDSLTDKVGWPLNPFTDFSMVQ